MNIFKQKIKTYLQSHEMPSAEFEKQAGLSNGTINKILEDKIQNPSINTTLKIAKALGCSLDELFNIDENINRSEIFYNNELFRSICLYIVYVIEAQQISHLKLEQVIGLINEIYNHCMHHNLNMIDTKYADCAIQNIKKTCLSND